VRGGRDIILGISNRRKTGGEEGKRRKRGEAFLVDVNTSQYSDLFSTIGQKAGERGMRREFGERGSGRGGKRGKKEKRGNEHLDAC